MDYVSLCGDDEGLLVVQQFQKLPLFMFASILYLGRAPRSHSLAIATLAVMAHQNLNQRRFFELLVALKS